MQCVCEKFSAPIESFDQAVERCRHWREIATTLERLHVDSKKWMAVAQCLVCGRLWAEEGAPFGEGHGGGPDCYYRIDTDDPMGWLAGAKRDVSAMARAQ